MKTNIQFRTGVLVGVPLVVIVAGFIAYDSGLYDELGITVMPVMGLATLSLAIVIVYQQIVIRQLRADDTNHQ